MKQKLLFVIPSLSAGGGERSLINLLLGLDYTRFDVDLYLLSHEGLFMDLIPPEVRLLPLPESYHRFTLRLKPAVVQLIRHRKLKLAMNRIMYSYTFQMSGNIGRKEQSAWKYISPSLGELKKQYDVAIGFLEKTSIYFCVEKVCATTKIGWIHNDYDKLGMNPDFDRRHFKHLNHIVTVSEECAQVLRTRFPEYGKKISVIYNIVSPSLIRQMAVMEESSLYDRSSANKTIILSIGRLHQQKCFELAIRACKLLIDRGHHIEWHVIGEGDEREKLTNLIRSIGLEDHFKLLGLKSNPYPYLHQADLYVQTSKFEGKSIAIDEAKIMNKPIVITNFSTAKDQIIHMQEGLIVDMTPEAVATAIGQLIDDKAMRNRFGKYLSGLRLGTESEIEKLYQLLE